MIDMKRTGRQLKDACDKRGITVGEIQRRLHIGSFQSVYAWFCGRTLPNLDNFYALAKLLGMPMESLIIEKRIAEACDFEFLELPGGVLLELCQRMQIERLFFYRKRLLLGR